MLCERNDVCYVNVRKCDQEILETNISLHIKTMSKKMSYFASRNNGENEMDCGIRVYPIEILEFFPPILLMEIQDLFQVFQI